MARYTGPVCKLCRREGQKLFLKGDRCYTGKCALENRAFAPGQHGQGRKKSSEYALQLRAKQKTKRFYGMQEKQFSHYFDLAEAKQGMTGENLLIILESRLDNVVYRAGFANSRRQARQFVLHGHFAVNGKKVNIPSYQLKAGDVITVRSKNQALKDLIAANEKQTVTPWLSADHSKYEINVTRMPSREEVDVDVEEHLIVELYSK
ncbi:MAG: 30S ribosomal protein S4 [Oscillospiraceae bacterium]|nr:30S ribosomal protein S4 [Oscillospiraceae bacterium]